MGTQAYYLAVIKWKYNLISALQNCVGTKISAQADLMEILSEMPS